jgi:hypothetical protein
MGFQPDINVSRFMEHEKRKDTHHNLNHHTPISPREATSAESIDELGDNGAKIKRG